ncbi:UNVERIFIED_ORG: 4-aminobutyrate aminotransferase-like enzyme [Pseudomonas putida]|nr:4-aminobutyrate aminotransferase-like enzyme [Pseudomonas putida]
MNATNLLERRRRVMGSASPLFYDTPLDLVAGDGVWLTDRDGRRYLDAYNNVPCVGHCNRHVAEAMYRQATTLNVHTRYINDKIVEYAERLTRTFDDSLNAAMFTCTGSEANELALRMARFSTGGTGVIVSNYNYHGNSTALAGLTTAMASAEPFPAYARAIPIPCLYHVDGMTPTEVLETYLGKVAEAIASMQASGIRLSCMLIDTFFANEGIPRIPPGYIERLTQMVHEAGGLMIVDEVQSGFGRTGEHLWGHQAYDAVPDLVTMGKPMGNGFPLAGVVTTRERVNAFGKAAIYFNTFGGSPVAAAVGMAVLDEIENRDLRGNARAVGAFLMEGLQHLAQKHSIIGDIRYKGLFFAVELVTDHNTKAPAGAEARRLINTMRQDGVLISRIGPGDNVLKIRPPLVFDQDNAVLLLSALDAALCAL